MTDTPKIRRIDPAKLKLRELAEIEKVVGRKLGGEFASGDLGMDTMAGLLWIGLRAEDPSATFEQAAEYDMDTITRAMTDGDDDDEDGSVDPTSPPASAANAASLNGSKTSKTAQPSTTSGT